jgi:5-bromo-4-chloroindolyl phosphate hydrolysis protein
MSLPDGPRQILAALLASAAFLGLFLGAALVWWLALGLAAVTYGALLLLIPRRRPLNEVMLTDQVSAADIARATDGLTNAAYRLNEAAKIAPPADRAGLADMSKHLSSIRELIKSDPKDYRQTKQFISYFLPLIVTTVESYVGLAKLAQGENAERLAELGSMIKGFVPVVQKIDQACIENDFTALEAQVSALQFQLKRV